MYRENPDEFVERNAWKAEGAQREVHDDRLAQTKMLSRVRLALRRILGRQNPPAQP